MNRWHARLAQLIAEGVVSPPPGWEPPADPNRFLNNLNILNKEAPPASASVTSESNNISSSDSKSRPSKTGMPPISGVEVAFLNKLNILNNDPRPALDGSPETAGPGSARMRRESRPVQNVQNVQKPQNPRKSATSGTPNQPVQSCSKLFRNARALPTDNSAEEPADIRRWREAFAGMVAMPAPVGFSDRRWDRILDAADMFLDRWAEIAIAASWSDLDAFGAHPTRPDVRFDCMGLVLSLDRRAIVAIDAQGADLVTAGVRLRFRRRPMPLGTVPLWALAKR